MRTACQESRYRIRTKQCVLGAACALVVALAATAAWSQESDLPYYLQDRGRGISTSQFGTYVEAGELLVYPFYEYTKTTGFEYKPRELGFTGSEDYLGTIVDREYLLFFSYGISDRLMIELEGALYIKSTFDKAANDPSDVPARIEESGLGDVETQIRWRWSEETENRPEMYSFVEVVFPFQKNRTLIGTSDWEGAFGYGVIRGFRWGTITGRVAFAYDGADKAVEFGEYAFEYLKRVSPHWRLVATIEGESDEVSLIGEAQWHFADWAFLKLNSGFGLTTRAPDIAPEVGIMFRF